MGNNISHTHPTAPPSALLLPRLEGVITTGKGWRARCPHCGGKGHKLSIAEGDNGTHALLAAVGLTIGDLFVRKDLRSMSPAERSQLRQAALLPKWKAALEVLNLEADVLLIAGNQLADNIPLSDTDLARVRVACLRIFDAKEVLHAR